MPPSPSKEDVVTAYRHSAFVQAAMRVFGEYGFERATMDRIAQEAQVAKGTIYLYYKSKQAIYDAALRSGFADLDERTWREIEGAATLREMIAAFIKSRADYFWAHPDFFRMYVAAVASHMIEGESALADVQAMLDDQTRRLEQLVQRAIVRREIRRVDSAATAVAIFDLTRGLVARRLTGSGKPDVRDDVAFLADLVWRGLRRETEHRNGAPKRAGKSDAQRSKRKK
jgi:AcrR family transcriptional regulator